MKFRKKPIVIEAFKLNERGLVEEDWFWDAVTNNTIITHYFGKFHPEPAWCEIKTLEGVMIAKAGDYIIRGVNGEIYPCAADIFEKTYEEEVKEGYWYSYDPERCSVCKLPWNYYMTMNGDDMGYFDPMPNFCPNCGAKDEEG